MGGVDEFTIETLMQEVPDIKLAVTTWYGAFEAWPQRLDMPRIRVNPTTDAQGLVTELSAL
jgi:hypothetical protein